MNPSSCPLTPPLSSPQYPSYLAAPPPDVKPEDLARYKDQHRIVSRVIETFDDPKFDNGTDSEKQALKDKVSGLMNEVSTMLRQRIQSG